MYALNAPCSTQAAQLMSEMLACQGVALGKGLNMRGTRKSSLDYHYQAACIPHTLQGRCQPLTVENSAGAAMQQVEKGDGSGAASGRDGALVRQPSALPMPLRSPGVRQSHIGPGFIDLIAHYMLPAIAGGGE